jgi:phospholipid/cholesterol/gamma-HCH transport system permease protein
MWIRHETENGASVLYLDGAWRLASLRPISAALDALKLPRNCAFILDGSRLGELDTAAAFTLCRRLAELGCDEAMVGTRAFAPRLERLLGLVRSRMRTPPAGARSTHRGLLSRLGVAALEDWRLIRVHNAFIGLVALELAALARRPRLFRARETVSQFEDVCLDAIPVVSLVTFLIGVVVAYLLGVQAQRYGAGIFVVDGVGLAICRELSPILVAVVVAGRSGAAFTAQIGAMKVQEEVDAIRTLGLSPVQVLVIPRLVALTLALPLLVFLGDLCGIAGGVAAANWQLGIAPQTFIDRLHAALPMSAVTVGLAKAPVFAVFIAMISCRMGLLVSRDARSVGENTTSTVVQCIVSVIVLDAIFAVTLQRLGI